MIFVSKYIGGACIVLCAGGDEMGVSTVWQSGQIYDPNCHILVQAGAFLVRTRM